MNTKTMFSHLNLVILTICAFWGFEENFLVAAVSFGDHIAGGGGQAPGPEKEPIPEYLKSVVSCKLGKPHRQYPECRCGERVEVVPKSEILKFESLDDYHIRVKHTHKGRRNFYYHCLYCSQCPDGVRTLSNCSRLADTQCTDSCIKPTDYFDKGRKACIADPRLEELTTKLAVATNSHDVAEYHKEGEGTGRPVALQIYDNNTPNGSSGKPQLLLADDMKYLLIACCALVVVVVIVLIVNIFTCKYMYHRRKHDQERESMLPRTTSRASMTDSQSRVDV